MRIERATLRKMAVRVAMPVVLALLLIGIPGYLSSRPAFFQKFPALEDEYATWKRSTHSETRCEECHAPPTVLAQATYRSRMVGALYVSLVNRSAPDAFSAPSDSACSKCHHNLRTVSPDGDLQIPHRAHIQVLGMRCIDCHDFVMHKMSRQGDHTPPMSGCLKCHDGERADDSCSACHTDKALPKSHQGKDWLLVHPQRRSAEDCEGCHAWTEDWCVDCHRSRPLSHDPRWRSTHGASIELHRGCEACHAGAFCVRCHGETPSRNLNPALRLVK